MCGIVGYAGGGRAAEIVFNGLERLEYRGYDSAGIAVMSDRGVSTVKKQGRVGKLLPYLDGLSGSVGIGHTRWATHGKPSDINAHPHTAGRFTVVHNGIIENYAELKEKLLSLGETFLSETDSEVIVHLLRRNFCGDFLSALARTLKMLKGSYAILVMCEGVDGFAAAKKKSSLIVGYGNGENFCASDEPALAGRCRTISVPDDGDIIFVTKEAAEFYDGDLNPVSRKKFPARAVAANLQLDGCPHYMLKEIGEVPLSVENTARAFKGVDKKIREVLKGVTRVIFVGCGTAYHTGLIGRRYIEIFANIPSEAETSGEFRYKRPVIDANTAVIAVTQSGETADTVEAARLAQEKGARVIAVTNAPYSAICRIAHVVVPVEAGPEICVAATKSYTGQLAALYLVALAAAGEQTGGKLSGVVGLCRQAVASLELESLAEICAQSSGVYFLGRDLDYAVALEGSLKLKEVSYIPGEGYPSGEIKHGPLALIDETTLTIAVICDENLADKSLNAVNEVLARGGRAAVITNIEEVAKSLSGRAEIVWLPVCDRLLSPLVSAVAVQKLAYSAAVLMGRDPDKPRNLAKSVTVE